MSWIFILFYCLLAYGFNAAVLYYLWGSMSDNLKKVNIVLFFLSPITFPVWFGILLVVKMTN